jgi:ketosteroid isomerase-like protein
MSAENVELHRQGYEAFNSRDREGWAALWDPHAEVVLPVAQIDGRESARGHEGMHRLWDEVLAIFPDVRLEVEEIADLGDTTLATVRVSAHGASGDVPIEQRSWHVARWRNGKGVFLQAFLTRAEALETAGPRE